MSLCVTASAEDRSGLGADEQTENLQRFDRRVLHRGAAEPAQTSASPGELVCSLSHTASVRTLQEVGKTLLSIHDFLYFNIY
jgi:hypothetical protein